MFLLIYARPFVVYSYELNLKKYYVFLYSYYVCVFSLLFTYSYYAILVSCIVILIILVYFEKFGCSNNCRRFLRHLQNYLKSNCGTKIRIRLELFFFCYLCEGSTIYETLNVVQT